MCSEDVSLTIDIESDDNWSSDFEHETKRSHRRRKRRRRHRRQKKKLTSSGCWRLIPAQPLYAWSFLLALAALLCGIASYVLAWLKGTATCIMNGENAEKLSLNISPYKINETRIIGGVQICIALMFALLTHKHATLSARRHGSHSKVPNILRMTFVLYAVLVYFVSMKADDIETLFVKYAHATYERFSQQVCDDTRFIINAEFTMWKQTFSTSIMLTLLSAVVCIFRSIFIPIDCVWL